MTWYEKTSEREPWEAVMSRSNVAGYEVIPNVLRSKALNSHSFVAELNEPLLHKSGLAGLVWEQVMLEIVQVGSPVIEAVNGAI